MGWCCDNSVHKGFVLLHSLPEMQSLGSQDYSNKRKQITPFASVFFPVARI